MKVLLRYLSVMLLLLAFGANTSQSQTGVLNPADPIVIYNPASPPATPAWNTLAKWVKTTRLGWNTNDFKAYYFNGVPFRLKFPKSYATAPPGTTFPLYLFFHGVGERGTMYDNEYSMLHGGNQHNTATNGTQFDGFLLYPQSTATNGYWNINQLTAVYTLIVNYLIPQVKVDPNRVIVNGLSGGGAATWLFTKTYPKLVAASIPMANASLADRDALPDLTYKSIWLASGGQDINPHPNTVRQVENAAIANGSNFKWTLYTTLAHNVWDSVWKEADYFPYLNRAHRANPWVRYGRAEFCPEDNINVTIGVQAGFNAYQWRKDGVVIPGATGNTINVTSVGVYDCRIQDGSTWSIWSPIPVTIQTKAPTISPNISTDSLVSRVLPAPDGSTTVTLKVPNNYIAYEWRRLPSTTLSGNTNTITVGAGDYQVKVTELYGCSSSFSETFTVVNANGPNKPNVPANLQATAISQTQVSLTWDINAGANSATRFEIYQSLASDGTYKLVGFADGTASSAVISGLDAAVRYYYKIRAVNNTAASAVTAVASALTSSDVTPPTAPNNLRAGRVGPNSVQLLWDHSTDNVGVVQYEIFVNGALAYRVPGDQNSFEVFNLTNGQYHQFIVKAKDAKDNISPASNQLVAAAAFSGLNYKYYTYTGTWNNLPNLATLTPKYTGHVPNVTLTPRDQNDNFAFLWEGFINIPAGGGTYTFRTRSDDGSKLYLGGLNQTTSPYNHAATPLVNNDGLHGAQNADGTITFSQGGVYPIAIVFYEQGGDEVMTVSWRGPGTNNQFEQIPNSAFEQNVASPGPVPASPSNLVASTVSARRINLTWQDNSNNETGFEIYRSTSESGPFAMVTTVGANRTSFADSLLEPTTTYYYRIKAIGQHGASGFDSEGAGVGYEYYETSGLSALPTNFSSLTPVKTGRVASFGLGMQNRNDNFLLRFSGYINITTAGTYTFFTNSDDGSKLYIGAFNEANLVVNNDLAHAPQEVSGSISLSAGRHPIFVTFFENGGGEVLEVRYQATGIPKQLIPAGVLGNPMARATTQALPALPDAATGLTATAQGANVVGLTWNNGAGVIDGVEVWRSRLNNANYELVKLTGNVNTYTDTAGLTANTVYYYKVRKVNEAGIAGFSNEVSVTTNSNPVSYVTFSALPNFEIYNDSTLAVTLNASSNIGSSITYTADNLPGFAILMSINSTMGILSLTPGGFDLGKYTVTLTATDNYGASVSRTFTITVNGKQQKTVNVNFNASLPQPAPWNNTNRASNNLANYAMSNLTYSDGSASTIGLTTVHNWTYSNTNGATTGNNSGVFPDNILTTVYATTSNTATQFRITNLSAGKKYSVLFFGGYKWTAQQQAQNGPIITNYSIGSQTVTLDNMNNTSNTVRINGITPDVNGSITVNVNKASGAYGAALNAIQIFEYDVTERASLSAPTGLTAEGLSASAIRLNWTAVSETRTGFQIWRSNTANGTYSLVGTVAGNVSTFTNSGLPANTTYYYKVRAVNNTYYSGYSNIAGASTVSYVVNLQFNGSASDAVNDPAWNSTNFKVYDGFTMSNLTNSLGQGTGIGFVGGEPFNNVSSSYGFTTGNNSGPVPDAVMRTNYYLGFTAVADFSFTNLNLNNVYNLTFYAGTTYTGSGNTVYSAGGKSVSLNPVNNTTNTVTLYNLQPDATGTIKVSIYSTSGYGWINSVSVHAMQGASIGGGSGASMRQSSSDGAVNAAVLQAEPAATVTKLVGYPNPFIDNITLQLSLKRNVPRLAVMITDLTGKPVYRGEFSNVPAGTWQQNLALGSRIPNPGTYVIYVSGIPGEAPKTFKITKTK